jgi:hypothetical protein
MMVKANQEFNGNKTWKKLKRSLNCKSITLIEMEWLLSTKNKSYKKKLLNSGILTKNKKPSNSSNSYKTHHK